MATYPCFLDAFRAGVESDTVVLQELLRRHGGRVSAVAAEGSVSRAAVWKHIHRLNLEGFLHELQREVRKTFDIRTPA